MFRTTIMAVTVLGATLAAAESPDGGTRSAKALDAEGDELFKAGKWHAATARFREAFTAEPKLAAAHYHFAATVFRSIRADGCSPSASTDEASEHLALSLHLDPRQLKRVAKDPDFDEFRHTAGYFAMIGHDVQSAAGISALLPKLHLHAPSLHDSGPLFRLEFHADGTLEVLDHTFEGGAWTWAKRAGSWKTRSTVADGGRSVLVELKAPATGALPALNYSGVVFAGRAGLVLPGERGQTFAADDWGVCCC